MIYFDNELLQTTIQFHIGKWSITYSEKWKFFALEMVKGWDYDLWMIGRLRIIKPLTEDEIIKRKNDQSPPKEVQE